jgi:hypothetical protein
MPTSRFSRPGRREDVRAWWANTWLREQRKSGQTQAAYCRARARSLDPPLELIRSGVLHVRFTIPHLLPAIINPAHLK